MFGISLIKLEFQTYFSFLDGRNYTNIIYNRSIDTCKAFKGNSVTRLVLVILKNVQKNSNAPFRCPVPVGEYYIHDVDLGVLNFPLGLPIGPVGSMKKSIKCSIILVSKMRDNRELFIAEYDIYIKVTRK